MFASVRSATRCILSAGIYWEDTGIVLRTGSHRKAGWPDWCTPGLALHLGSSSILHETHVKFSILLAQ